MPEPASTTPRCGWADRRRAGYRHLRGRGDRGGGRRRRRRRTGAGAGRWIQRGGRRRGLPRRRRRGGDAAASRTTPWHTARATPRCGGVTGDGGGGRELGRRRRRRRRPRLGRHRGAVRHPRRRSAPPRSRTSAPTARRSPRPSRRCGSGTAPSRGVRTFANADCGFGYRHSRFKADPGRHVVLDVTFQLAPGQSRRPDRSTPSSPAPSASRSASALRSPRCARRCSACAAARGWCSTRPTTTPGAPARSSPTPSIDPAAVPEGAPAWPQPDGRVKTSAAWLIERAGFSKGYGDGPRRPVDQAHPRADQPRRRDHRPRCSRWPARSATASRRRTASGWSTSRSSSAASSDRPLFSRRRARTTLSSSTACSPSGPVAGRSRTSATSTIPLLAGRGRGRRAHRPECGKLSRSLVGDVAQGGAARGRRTRTCPPGATRSAARRSTSARGKSSGVWRKHALTRSTGPMVASEAGSARSAATQWVRSRRPARCAACSARARAVGEMSRPVTVHRRSASHRASPPRRSPGPARAPEPGRPRGRPACGWGDPTRCRCCRTSPPRRSWRRRRCRDGPGARGDEASHQRADSLRCWQLLLLFWQVQPGVDVGQSRVRRTSEGAREARNDIRASSASWSSVSSWAARIVAYCAPRREPNSSGSSAPSATVAPASSSWRERDRGEVGVDARARRSRPGRPRGRCRAATISSSSRGSSAERTP